MAMTKEKGDLSNTGDDSDEEPDYMSEDFLKECTKADVRPSLIYDRKARRENEILKRREELNKRKEEREKDRLKSMEDALKTPISAENKGFKMIQKMGFKPGSALGKPNNPSSSSSSGIKEPISIDLTQRRGGLGLKRKHQEKQKANEIKTQLQEEDIERFRLRQQSAAKSRITASDLRKAQFSCQNLDQESGLKKPLYHKWYWQTEKKKKAEVPPGEGELSKEESEDYDDFKDLGLPKPPQRPKLVITAEADDETESESEDEEDDDQQISDEDKLTSIFNYLRTTYFYCLWCGAKYADIDEMNSTCPGIEKDDH